jgi:hypothetical protein
MTGRRSTLAGMLDRLWWFIVGLVAGGVVTTRALRRRPTGAELRHAAARSTADLLSFAARRIRPR